MHGEAVPSITDVVVHGAVKLCMFHPVDHPMKRGWVGRIDEEHVIQLAAQTLPGVLHGRRFRT